MIDPESSINSARLTAIQRHGRSDCRCGMGSGPERCHAPLPETQFFCAAHVDAILSSEDVDVLSAWGRLQGDIHRARKAAVEAR